MVLFILSYYVRSGFLATKDYNEPSDANEYRTATQNVLLAIQKTYSFNDLNKTFPWATEALDAHSAPSYMLYSVFVNMFFSAQRLTINVILSSLFIVILFLVSLRFFSLWIAILVSSLAVIYTPHFAYVYSYMPESFGGFFVPTLSLAAVFVALRASKNNFFAILTGIFLGLIALYRIEFRWIGIPFAVIWFISSFHKKNVISAVLMFGTYAFIAFGWMIVAYLLNPRPYYNSGNVLGTFYNAYNWTTFGWQFDTAPIRGWGWGDILGFVFSQGPFKLLWLELAQVIRLWSRPATVYIGEYLIADSFLFSVHNVFITLALLGLRKIFFERKFLLLGVILIWVSFLSYWPEDLRRQIPLIGIMLIFAGAGISELCLLWKKSFKKAMFLIILLGGVMIGEKLAYGFLGIFYPQFVTILPLRILLISTELFLAFKIMRGLLILDKKRKQVIKNGVLSKIPSAIPLIIVCILVIYYLRMPSWHEWKTTLLPNNKIQQTIILDEYILADLKEKKGYVLIDIKDPKAAKNIEVNLNQKLLSKRFSIQESFSPIDIRVIRQFQREMPRLGWGTVEDSVYSSSAFSNVRQWIIHPISGDVLKKENIIVIKNKSQSYDDPPLIYGDYYFSLLSNMTYDGPTPRIFQGAASFYKFQVDGEIRLPERRIIHSVSNVSAFFENEKKNSDLSTSFGVQTGRYRIFLLFPYITSDTEDIF